MVAKKEARGKIQRWLDHVFGFDDDPRKPATRARRLLQLCVLIAREFRKDLCWERAATLGFTTIISLLPIGFLFLSLFSLSFETDEKFQAWVADTALPFILPEDTALPFIPPEVGSEGAARTEPDATGLISVSRAWIRKNISLDKFKTQVAGNVLALVALVISALALLVTAERVFNGIWNVARARHYFQKFVAFWVILTTSPVLIAFSFKIRTTEIHLYEFFMPTVVSCTAFTLLYLFLPNTRVRFLPGLVGGCFAGLVWEVLKVGFYVYFNHAISLSAFYGALALVPIFLVFVYASWLIVLAGAEISYSLQHFDQLRFQQAVSQKRGGYSYAYLALAYLERVTIAFEQGLEVPSINDVARDLEADPEHLRPVVDSLVGMGVLVENAVGDQQFYPARAPERVALRDVVESLIVENFSVEESQFRFEPTSDDPPVTSGAMSSPSRSLQGQAIRSYLACFDGKTLLDLARRQENAPGALREAQVLRGGGS
jgi:membrane protein